MYVNMVGPLVPLSVRRCAVPMSRNGSPISSLFDIACILSFEGLPLAWNEGQLPAPFEYKSNQQLSP